MTAIRSLLGTLLLCSAAAAGAQPQSAAPAAALHSLDAAAVDAYARNALAKWRVPGMAVTVVKDGRTLLQRGYGVRRLGVRQEVNERTRFNLASASKAFTAALIGQLVDEKKLKWDDSVSAHLPDLVLPTYARDTTLRDLATHRSGMGAASYHFMQGATRDLLLTKVRALPQAAPPRAQLVYNNIGYVVLGEVAERAAGARWDDLLRARLFAPLGMDDATTSAGARRKPENEAATHAEIGGRMQAIDPFPIDSVAPAGGIYASARDMAPWMNMWLAWGKSGDRTILSEATVRGMQHMHMPLPVSGVARIWPSTHFYGYALGWFVRDYRGIKVVEHGGNTSGTTSFVLLAPELGFGVTVLANADQSDAPTAVAYRALDLALGGNAPDVGAALAAQAKPEVPAGASPAAAALPLQAYAGRYASPLYGTVAITVDRGGELGIQVHPRLRGKLVPLGEHKFDVRWGDPFVQEVGIYRPLGFALDSSGKPAGLTIEKLSNPPPKFERLP